MIGIFDSGCGGLTVLRALRTRMPTADVVYFGDTKNAPYGLKSKDELFALTGNALALLQKEGATNLISACNSVSTSLALSLFDTLSISSDRLIEMVGPTVRNLKDSDARIGLVATVATIESGIYQNAFHMVGKEVEAIAIPELAGAIESGAVPGEIDRIVASALEGKEDAFDMLILACTHYPLVMDSFRTMLGEQTTIFDPAIAVAERAEKEWGSAEVGSGNTHFLISKDSEVFRAFVAEMFPQGSYSIEVIK